MLRWTLILQTAQAATYLPGVAPRSYSPEDSLKLYVNKLTSTHTQIPYDYYSLPFCKPDNVVNAVENLGEVLHGSVLITRSARTARQAQRAPADLASASLAC